MSASIDIEENTRRLMAEVQAVASKASPALLSRDVAALIVAEITGAPYAESTLRRSSCPYRVVGRVALYSREDIVAHAEQLKAQAPIRRGRVKSTNSSGIAGGGGSRAA
jgi:hypothetical protein